MDVSFGLNSHHPITSVVVRAFIGSVFELRCSGAVQQIKYSLWPSVLKLKRTTFPPFNVCNWYYCWCQRALDCFFLFYFFYSSNDCQNGCEAILSFSLKEMWKRIEMVPGCHTDWMGWCQPAFSFPKKRCAWWQTNVHSERRITSVFYSHYIV